MKILRVWRELTGFDKFAVGCAVIIILVKILMFVSVAYVLTHFIMKWW